MNWIIIMLYSAVYTSRKSRAGYSICFSIYNFNIGTKRYEIDLNASFASKISPLPKLNSLRFLFTDWTISAINAPFVRFTRMITLQSPVCQAATTGANVVQTLQKTSSEEAVWQRDFTPYLSCFYTEFSADCADYGTGRSMFSRYDCTIKENVVT